MMPYPQSPSSSEQTDVQTTPSNQTRPYVKALAFRALVTIMQTIPGEKSPDNWSEFGDKDSPPLTDGLSGSPTDVFCQEFNFQDVFDYEQTTTAERTERNKPHRSRLLFSSLPSYVRGNREVRTRHTLIGSGRKARSFPRRDKVLRK
jgi:hypothetical protein